MKPTAIRLAIFRQYGIQYPWPGMSFAAYIDCGGKTLHKY